MINRVAQNIQYQLPTHGRIRLGTKNEKGWPISLKTFRFTSSDEGAIEAIANEFGGTPKPWQNGRNAEYEVITEAKEINVVLPPDCVEGPIWEYWQKGGKLFDCDGQECIKTTSGPDGPEYERVPCLCDANDKLVCKPTTRLRVLLHNVPLGGAWQLTTGSLIAASELSGMIEVVQLMYNKTLTPAKLAIEPRSSSVGGQTKHYVVPVLRSGSTMLELEEKKAPLSLVNPVGIETQNVLASPEYLND